MSSHRELSPERPPDDCDATLQRDELVGEFVKQEGARENLRVFVDVLRDFDEPSGFPGHSDGILTGLGRTEI